MAELRNEFTWSKSRAETFSACPRRYYFTYYGAWGGWDAKADMKARTLYVLKNLQTRQQWMGSTVHNCLHWVLTEMRAGATPREEVALHALARRMNKDFQESGEGLYWENPKKICGLIEHEYDDLEVADEVWAAVFKKALAAVSVFYRSDLFRTLAAMPNPHWLETEKLSSFTVDGIKVWVQIDCAYQEASGDLRIIDWKTGKPDAPATREQLALYAFYASQKWHTDPARIVAEEFNLNAGERMEQRYGPADFEAVRSRIADSSAAMKALLDDPVANRASEDRFSLTNDDTTCRTCPFRRVCPKWATADAG